MSTDQAGEQHPASLRTKPDKEAQDSKAHVRPVAPEPKQSESQHKEAPTPPKMTAFQRLMSRDHDVIEAPRTTNSDEEDGIPARVPLPRKAGEAPGSPPKVSPAKSRESIRLKEPVHDDSKPAGPQAISRTGSGVLAGRGEADVPVATHLKSPVAAKKPPPPIVRAACALNAVKQRSCPRSQRRRRSRRSGSRTRAPTDLWQHHADRQRRARSRPIWSRCLLPGPPVPGAHTTTT